MTEIVDIYVVMFREMGGVCDAFSYGIGYMSVISLLTTDFPLIVSNFSSVWFNRIYQQFIQ